MIVDIGKCSEQVHSSWTRASIIRATKKARVSSMDQLRSLYFPDYSLAKADVEKELPLSHRKGLLGEILTELVVRDCAAKVNLMHVNWQLTGTSTGRGLDLLGLEERESNQVIILFESKFVGSSSLEEPTERISAVINAAFFQLSDYSELEYRLAPALHSIARRNMTSAVQGYDLATIRKLLEARSILSVVSVTVGTEGVLHGQLLATCPRHVENIPRFLFSTLDLCSHPILSRYAGDS